MFDLDDTYRRDGHVEDTAWTKRAKKSVSATKAPFPFLGQGEANDYEWFEMWIWFEKPVPKSERAELVVNGPPPCLRDLQWPMPELMWPSTGDQWIRRHLTEAYGKSKAQAKFNDAIERWLLEMHAKHPILFAVRREDSEAGGTKLGAWHADSVESFVERVSPALEALAKKKLAKDDKRRAPITLALGYVGPEKFTPAVRRLADKKRLVKTASPDAKAEEDALWHVSNHLLNNRFAEAEEAAKQITSPNGRLQALVNVTDHLFSMGADVAPVHRLILSMVGALENRKLSVVRALPYAKREFSNYLVCVPYAGLLRAAAWKNDDRTFDAVAALLDEMPEALRWYLGTTAEALDAKRPDFAKRVRALLPAPTEK